MRRWWIVGAIVAVVAVTVAVAVLLFRARGNDSQVKRAADRVLAPAGWQLISEQDKNDAVLGQCVASSGCVQSIRTWLADVSPEEFVELGTAMLVGAGVEVGPTERCQFRPNVRPAARDCELTGATTDAEVTLRWRHPEYAERVVEGQPVGGRALVTLTMEPG